MFFKHKTSVSSGVTVVFFVYAIVVNHASMAQDLKQTDRDHPNMRDGDELSVINSNDLN